MAKTSRKLLLACLTVLACIALIVAGTYALFTANPHVTNHLAAGNLTATLTRDNLETVLLNENGNLTKTTDPNDVDFTGATEETLFGLKDGTVIAPGCSLKADMILSNKGSVAFTYWIEIVLNSDSNELAQQLEVQVVAGEKTVTQSLSEGPTLGSEGTPIGTVTLTAPTAAFTVTVTFKDDPNNNAAQNQEVDIDLIVHATQDVTVTNA